MQVRQGFYRRNRRGQVIKVIRERYVQTDRTVGFGFIAGNKVTLTDLRELVKCAAHKQLLVVDTNVALHQIDVLEHKSPVTAVVVILQTVLQEVRHLNISVYRRLLALLQDDTRAFIFFPNEVCEKTFAVRNQNEKINDFNDRRIRIASLYYQRALGPSNLSEAEESSDEESDAESDAADDEMAIDKQPNKRNSNSKTDSSAESSASSDADTNSSASDDEDDESDMKFGDVVLLSNDKANCNLATEEGIRNVLTMNAFISLYVNQYPELNDLVSFDISQSNDSSSSTAGSRPPLLYQPHLSDIEIVVGIRSKIFVKGILRVKRDNCNDCYVIVHEDSSSSSSGGGGKDSRRSITIFGMENVNRAIDGDIVAIQVLKDFDRNSVVPGGAPVEKALPDATTAKRSKSTSTASIMADTAEVSEEVLDSVEVVDEQTSTSNSSNNKKAGVSIPTVTAEYGKVVGIVRRQLKQYAGSLSSEGELEVPGAPIPSTSMLFKAIDRRIPPIRILVSAHRRADLVGNRLLVCVDQWPAHSPVPLGHYVKSLGVIGEKAVENAVLLHEFGVQAEAFSASVMNCLPPIGWRITEDIISQRTDLRHLPVVSVDPPGCKDIDDALHCIELPNGNLQIGVHIADVTYFVHPDTPLDKEAARRSTSTYLVERRLDMLPGLLTTQLCSLRCNEDHLAFTVLWEMDHNGNIIDVSYCKSTIHSVGSLSYADAQLMMDNPDDSNVVNKSINLLAKIARILRQNRIAVGALTLSSPEVRFKLDSDSDNHPTDVCMYALRESNSMVEEFMLLANITVAKKILRHFPSLAVLRRHQPPSVQQFAPLVSAAAAVGVKLDITSSKTLADSLDAAVRPNDEYFNKLLRILSTRCMMPAQYFCSGVLPKESWHHYGLAAPVYTHFTSPIRRYADVIVHRLLAAAIGVIALPASNADRPRQQDLCSHMNRRHKAAQLAQRASTQLHTVLFFQNRPMMNERAYVMNISVDKIDVIIPRFGIEGSLSVDDIKLEYELQEGTAAEGEVVCNYDPNLHFFEIAKYYTDKQQTSKKKEKKAAASIDNVSANYPMRAKDILMAVQVFDPIEIRITVEESDSGNKSLKLALVLDSALLKVRNGPPSAAVAIEDVAITMEEVEVNYKGSSSSNASTTSAKKKRKAGATEAEEGSSLIPTASTVVLSAAVGSAKKKKKNSNNK